MENSALVQRIDRLERSVEKLKKDLKRCVEYPNNAFYPYFPQIVRGDKGTTLSLSERMLTVSCNGKVVGSIILN
jgi:hypothetical protein